MRPPSASTSLALLPPHRVPIPRSSARRIPTADIGPGFSTIREIFVIHGPIRTRAVPRRLLECPREADAMITGSFVDYAVTALEVALALFLAFGACQALRCLFFRGDERQGDRKTLHVVSDE